MTVKEFCEKKNLEYGQTDGYQKSEYNHCYIHIPNGFKEDNIFDAKELGNIIYQFEKVAFCIDSEEDEVIIDLANPKFYS